MRKMAWLAALAVLCAAFTQGALGQPGGKTLRLVVPYGSAGAPDGQTLFVADTGHWAINVALRPDLPYDPLKDFVPVIERFTKIVKETGARVQ